MELACSIRGERGEQTPPCPIMHALLSQWIRPVKRLAAAKSNLIQKTFFFFFCIKMRPNFVEKQKLTFSGHLHFGPTLFTCVYQALMQIPAAASKSAWAWPWWIYFSFAAGTDHIYWREKNTSHSTATCPGVPGLPGNEPLYSLSSPGLPLPCHWIVWRKSSMQGLHFPSH